MVISAEACFHVTLLLTLRQPLVKEMKDYPRVLFRDIRRGVLQSLDTLCQELLK